jgi:quercetin dioxygenase-like cupin family protein
MEPGDSLLFKADQPHSFRNLENTTTQLLIVLGDQTMEEREFSRKVHLRF